jgi:lysophospholipase L1-like esterase
MNTTRLPWGRAVVVAHSCLVALLVLCGPPVACRAGSGAWVAYPEEGKVVVRSFSPGSIGRELVVVKSGASPLPCALAIGADGMPAVSWLSLDGDILYSRYDGVGWSSPETVSFSKGNHRGIPSLALNGGSCSMVAWAENVEGSPEDIFFSLRGDGCWSETYRAHEENEVPDIEPHVTAVADGGFSLTWQCLSNGRYVKRHIGGVTVPETSEEYFGEGLDEVFDMGLPLQATLGWRDDSGASHSVFLGAIDNERDTRVRGGFTDEGVAARAVSDGAITIIAYGDSITYGRGSRTNGPRTGYPLYLQAILNYNYPGQSFRVINEGKPGERTAGGVNRISSVLSQYDADFILIMEGTNDIYFQISFETIQENLKLMAAKAVEAGVKPILATITPPHPDIRPAEYLRTRSFYLGNYIQALNDRYGIGYADQWRAFVSIPDFGSTLINPNPGNHPNDNGYMFVMAPEWYETLAPRLELPFESLGPSLDLGESTSSVSRGSGETFSYTLEPSNNLVRNGVDCYVALKIPGNRLYFFDSRWQLNGDTTPVAAKVLLNDLPPSGILVELPIGSGWPTGSYTLYLVCVRSLRNPWNSENWTSNLAEIHFEVIE